MAGDVEAFDTESYLDEHIDPIVQSLREQLGISQSEALRICIFSLANRINFDRDELPEQIDIQTANPKDRVTLTWVDRTQLAPTATDYLYNVMS